MASRRQPRIRPENSTQRSTAEVGHVRIIGGKMRGRSWDFTADPRTRPMKDRLREALFNLLGPAVQRSHAVDLFAGTGALGFEAISRGAVRATFIERHVPTLKQLRESARMLEIESVCQFVAGDTFVWARRTTDFGPEPVAAFCSPPYEFYASRSSQIHDLLAGLLEQCPAGSRIVAEFDDRFCAERLPQPERWRVRCYSGISLAISEPT
ncbi:MAG: SAM-dependent methyltransferase [Planctomycetes bacterium]|nr:SAM-dependent methyltransferase [Planctomycetota bacterium]